MDWRAALILAIGIIAAVVIWANEYSHTVYRHWPATPHMQITELQDGALILLDTVSGQSWYAEAPPAGRIVEWKLVALPQHGRR